MGYPLIKQKANLKELIQTSQIFPANDNKIYFSDHGIIKKLELDVVNLITLKELVDKSPFTFPGVVDFIYIGSKTTKIINVNAFDGNIISDSSQNILFRNKDLDNLSNNIKQGLLTLLRTDYSISSIEKNTGIESWNMSVSEITILNVGMKNIMNTNIDTQEMNINRNSIVKSDSIDKNNINLTVYAEKSSLGNDPNQNYKIIRINDENQIARTTAVKDIDEMYFQFLNEYFKILIIKIKSGDVSNRDLDMYFMTDKWLKIRKEMLKAKKDQELSKNQIIPLNDANDDLNIIDLTDKDKNEPNQNITNFDDLDINNLVVDESLYNQLMINIGLIFYENLIFTSHFITYVLSLLFILLAFVFLILLLISYIGENRMLKKQLSNVSNSSSFTNNSDKTNLDLISKSNNRLQVINYSEKDYTDYNKIISNSNISDDLALRGYNSYICSNAPELSAFKLSKISESLILPNEICKQMQNKTTNTNVKIIKDNNLLLKIEKSEVVTSFLLDEESEKTIVKTLGMKRPRTKSESMKKNEILEINFNYQENESKLQEIPNIAFCSFKRKYKNNNIINEEDDYFKRENDIS